MSGLVRCRSCDVRVVVLLLVVVCDTVIGATLRSDCVERSLCYHSSDCCTGCCEDNQCVTDTATTSQCSDRDVARNCTTLTCPENQECSQETRFCLIAPCPQPLPKCVRKKPPPPPRESEVPLPVQYN